MTPVEGNLSAATKSSVDNHKKVGARTLDFGRAVTWTDEESGTSKKADSVAQKSLENRVSSHNTQNPLPFEKNISQTEKSQSAFKIINWSDAKPHIVDQIKEMWPNRTDKFEKGAPEGDRIVCITEGDKLVGCVALEQLKITEPNSLVELVGTQKVYKLDIQIDHNYQGKGYGRAVFNSAVNLAINEGSLVFLVDKSVKGVGDRLYGGEKTRELFDVYHVFKGDRGEYLLKGKTQENSQLNYLKMDPKNTHVFFTATDSPEGMSHLVNYLAAHPEDKSLIDPSIIRNCSSMIKLAKKFWNKEQITKYNESLEKLRAALQ